MIFQHEQKLLVLRPQQVINDLGGFVFISGDVTDYREQSVTQHLLLVYQSSIGQLG